MTVMTGRSCVIAEQLCPAPSLPHHARALQPRLLGGGCATQQPRLEDGSVAEDAGVLRLLRFQLQVRLEVARASAADVLTQAGQLGGGPCTGLSVVHHHAVVPGVRGELLQPVHLVQVAEQLLEEILFLL